jgi:gamma-glutamylcyclotransferase (GGCT)/AIG2-like uncharacterized protein YtfP
LGLDEKKEQFPLKQKQECNNLFVYGTLRSGKSRHRVLEGLRFSKAILPGYKKVSPTQLGFPLIIRDKVSMVEGEIYFNLTKSHWEIIDQIEGEGSLYHRILVNFNLIDKNENITAYVYYPSQNIIERYSQG